LRLFVFDGKGDPFLGRHCPAALERRFVCGLAQPERCGGHWLLMLLPNWPSSAGGLLTAGCRSRSPPPTCPFAYPAALW